MGEERTPDLGRVRLHAAIDEPVSEIAKDLSVLKAEAVHVSS